MTPATNLRTSGDRMSSAIREKLEVLTGERGAGQDRAVRVKDLMGLNNALAGVTKQTGSIASKLSNTSKSLADTITEIGNLIDQSSTDVTDLQGRMTTAEADITTLKSDVQAIKAKLAAAKSVAIPGGTATGAAGGTPTAAEFAKVVVDLNNLRAAMAQIVNAF